ncbi:hypothetical protein B0J15DRAFT_455512 [Fusarium solani]|uniref:BZIP domain-containing protein n=1 Tax=Fusarium solani TaxID=169388 RepID=A0A9P9G4W0_FUSSL|nr:uncharacterized protein B0J15DRAFT_455512 [Fusarium solani]KAH7232546.1 hypothetical protein B0J15DRAFT_455512 [Fusarium solani]
MSIFMTQTACAYTAAPPSPKQHSRTSSAFSTSAKPDEDWTKISDLVERRRIQNRIAQRNYRKKLKQRLEDLERRAGFSSDSESKEKPHRTTKSKRSSSKPWKPQPCTDAKPVVSQGQFTYPMEPADGLFPGIYSPRAHSDSPTQFASSTHSASDNDPAQAYPTMAIGDAYHNDALAPIIPMIFPSIIHTSAAIECEPCQAGDELALSATYHYTPPMGFNTPCPYDQPNFDINESSERSSNCSEAGYEYPTKPLSMPNRPGRIHSPETEDYIYDFHLNPVMVTTMTKTSFALDHEHGQM